MVRLQQLIDRIWRVTLQTSNQCPYVHHKLCPAQHITEKQTLPTAVVGDILRFLQRHEWVGGIAWHVYNEPMVDPRLMCFVRLANTVLPKSRQLIYTNGWNLTEVLCGEMIDAGASHWSISAYTDEEYQRILQITKSLKGRAKFSVNRNRGLDNRMQLITVEADAKKESGYKPCQAPISDLTIRASGNVGLCCYDWAETEAFGNAKDGFEKAIVEHCEEMLVLQDQLESGIRVRPYCKQCKCRHGKGGVRRSGQNIRRF